MVATLTPELITQILDGGGTLALAIFVWVGLRDQNRTLRAIERGIAVLCDRVKPRDWDGIERRDPTPRIGSRVSRRGEE